MRRCTFTRSAELLDLMRRNQLMYCQRGEERLCCLQMLRLGAESCRVITADGEIAMVVVNDVDAVGEELVPIPQTRTIHTCVSELSTA